MPQMQLDDENETLDWGNEEEEYQESARRLHTGGNAGDDTFVGDDVEDTISLGDDEDDQRFYSLSRHDATNSSSSCIVPPASSPSSQSRSTVSGANPAQLGHRSPTQGVHLSAQETPFSQETLQKKSAARHSPQRSLPRLTHALPPKPVAASATALAQPYPTVVAVTTITPISPRSAGRDSKDMNDGKLGLSPPSADLPQDWESRCSRKGETYYYNRVTHECTWTLPSRKPSVVPSSAQEESKSRPQRRSVSPGGNKEIVSFDSNTNRPQTSRPNFSRAGEPEIEEKKRPLTPDANGLTFEDRHYRPGLNSVSMADGIRGFERSDIPTSAGRYARSPSPRLRKPASPPSSELHIRTKEVPRDQRSLQEKSTHTKTSAPKLDSYRPDYDSRRWPLSPPPRSPTDYHARTQREHASYVTSEEDRVQVEADHMPGRKEDTARDRHQRSRERDLPPARNLDVRDPSASQNYFSAQRSRSPAPVPRERDRDIRDGKRESREHVHHYEGDARYSEWERSRQYERSHGPKSTQDYASGRERPIEPDVDLPRGRNSERERVRGDRSEQNRDIHKPRREVNNGIDADQRSQGDTKSKRNVEDRKPEELASARSKRAPLPPQQTSFRSARLRDPPPHPTSTPSKRPEDNARAGVVEDGLPRQPRNSSSAVQPLDVNRPPNGGDLHRFLDGHERQERPPIWDGASHSDKRANVIRDDSSRIERRQLGPTDRRLPEEVLRPSNIPLDSDGRGSLRPRGSVNDNGQRDSNHDKVKDEKHREGGDRDVRPQFEQNNSRRGRDAPSQPTRLTGTNNVPIGNRRSVVGGSDPEVGPPATIPVRKLPPGKESYERPPDVDPNSIRQPGSSSRTESGKNRPLHDLRQPQTRHDDEARSRKALPHFLVLTEQYPNGSNNPSTPLPLSRDLSGSILSVPGRLSTYPSSDGRSEVSFRANQNTDLSARSRESYRHRDESITRRDPHRGLRRLSHSPIQLPDEVDGPHSRHLSAVDDLPPRLRNSGGTGPDLDPRYSSSGLDRSDFISRVEPPPLRRGGSLLDRLSMDNKDRGLPTDSLAGTSLRDRLVPSKRDRDEMMYTEASSGRGLGEMPQDLEGSESKRAKKRGGKRRSAGRRI